MYHLITFVQSSACPFFLLYKYWDLPTEWQWWKHCSVFSLSQCNQRCERWTFTSEKTPFAASDWMNDTFSHWKLIVRSVVRETTSLLARKMASHLFIFKMSKRFGASVRSVDRFFVAVIEGGFYSINVNRVHQSSKLTIEESLLA